MKSSYWLFLVTVFALLGCMHERNQDLITVISREASSGTRTAFDKVIGLLDEDTTIEKEKESNALFKEAITSPSSDAVSLSVAHDPNAIGYTSLISVNDENKIISLGTIHPSLESFSNESYPIIRPFVFVMKTLKPGQNNRSVRDFLNFVMSSEGQKIIENAGYVSVKKDSGPYFPSKNLSNKIVIAGSTSLEKIMSKLQESYTEVQPNVRLEIQYIGSTAGIMNVLQGRTNLGISSRSLTNKEKKLLKSLVFAYDGIVVIVNHANLIQKLSIKNLQKIYSGQIRHWSDLVTTTLNQ